MVGLLRVVVVLLVLVGVAGTASILPSTAAASTQTPRLQSVIDFRSQVSRGHTVFRRLAVRSALAGSKISLSCKGGGCPFKVRTRTVRATAASLSLTSLVGRAKLRARALLEVRVTKPSALGTAVRFRIRRSARPNVTMLCQRPGESRMSACTYTRGGAKAKPAPTSSPISTPTVPTTTTTAPATTTTAPATTTTAPATTTTAPATTTTTTPPATSTTAPATTTTPLTTTTAPTTTIPQNPVPPAVERLRFGVYPWGTVGCVEQCAPSVPENADRSMAMVKQLKGSRSLVVHLYGDYDGVSDASADSLLSEASWWSSNGLKISAVLRYRPADAGRAAGYPAWVRTQARRLAALTGTSSIQIGNEPNNPAPDAGDGSYPGVVNAIAAGVPAARAEVVGAGRSEILIGFNWAAGESPTTTEPMWAGLEQAGGSAFTQAVGFVGVNVYPGTWTAPVAPSGLTAALIDTTTRSTLDAVRNKHMLAAGVGGAGIVITETGYPTTAARTATMQDLVLRTVVGVAESTKSIFGVTGVYWFALRDGNTASGQLENGYGLLRDDYTPKPAFTTLQGLVATTGA